MTVKDRNDRLGNINEILPPLKKTNIQKEVQE
jgi:hypothetical protein